MAGALVAGAVVAGAVATALPAGAVAPPPRASLATSFVTTAGTWAVVPMGNLSDPLNTFWQAFFRPAGATTWRLVTPPGVADNGGLTTSGPGWPVVTVGFEPSNLLRFSPIAQTPDDGTSWTPGVLAQALAPVPDALGGAPTPAGPGVRALARPAGGTVVASANGLEGWRTVVTGRALARTSSGRRCGLTAVTAVAVVGGTTVVGGSCGRPGVLGVFTAGPGGWRLVGPLPGRGSGPTTVLRLTATGPDSLAGLVSNAARSRLWALWSSDGGTTWTVSPPLRPAPGSAVVSSGFGPSGARAVVVVHRPGTSGVEAADVVPGAGWRILPRPPAGTAAVVEGPGATVDALTVASTRMTDWTLQSTGTWARGPVIVVPIPFGSSS